MRRILKSSLLLALLLPGSVFASVKITNVLYDVEGSDAGREWIEITNTGAEAVDVSDFRLLEAGVHHKLKVVQGNAVLAPAARAVIADNATNYLLDHSDYTGTLFDSSFSLSNTGETLVLKNSAGNVEDTYSYTAPVVEKPAPKKVAVGTVQKSAATATSSAYSRVKFEGGDQQAASSFTSYISLGLLGWIGGLISLIALGIAGVVLVRQERAHTLETKKPEDEFAIVEN